MQGETLFDSPFGGDPRRAFDEGLIDAVRAVDGVEQAEPFVIVVGFGGTNRLLDKDGDTIGATQGPPTLFESWYGNDELSPYVLKEGRGPEADDEIALNTAAAEDGDYAVGDQVDLLTQFGVQTYELVGIVNFGTAKSSAGAVSVEFTLAEAQRLAGTPGKINQVVAKAEDGPVPAGARRPHRARPAGGGGGDHRRGGRRAAVVATCSRGSSSSRSRSRCSAGSRCSSASS